MGAPLNREILHTMKRPTLAALAATIALVATPNADADLELSEVGAAALGKLTTFTVKGNPGDQFLLVASLVNSGTLPPPHQPTNIDVGLELISLSFTIPGWLGTVGPGGTAQIFLPFPPDISLDPLTLHFQALQHDGVLFTGKSNPCSLTPNIPLFTEPTLGTMEVLRAGHTMTELQDGRFLIIGGGPDGLVASFGQTSMELYDPCTQKFTKVGDLLSPRTSHTSTLLPDGRILVVGGADDVTGEPTAACELIDPSNGYSTTPTAGALSEPRALHTATLLPDGRVLIIGGTNLFNNSPQDLVENAPATTELSDPVTDTFSPGPTMPQPRVGHNATVLPNLDVLITGGFSWITVIGFKVPFISDQAQRYTPNAGAGVLGAQMTMTSDRFGHTSVLKDDGKVLIFGGAKDQFADPFNPLFISTVEEFDPQTDTFVPHGNLSMARGIAALVKLPGDVIVAAGGAWGGLALALPDDTLDVYNGTFGSIQFTIQMTHVRANFTASLLDNGAILLAGGGEEGPIADPNNFDDAELLTLP